MKRHLVAGLLVCSAALGAVAAMRACGRAAAPPVRVGVLHSFTGTMAISERAVADATLMAIDEINARGGVLGRKLVPVVADGASDGDRFAAEAERLITREGVSVVFGCWTSASRKMVKPVFERHRHLLFYPVQYEGLEQSPNIVYTGAAPNQQIIPAVKWAFDNLGHTFFLVGSDYIFPRTASEIIRDQVAALEGAIVGEEYIPLGSKDVDQAVAAVVAARPKVILNTINGDTNLAFFRALREAGITPDHTPTLSFSIAEGELQSLGAVTPMVGDYACWNYFQSLTTPENLDFVRRFTALPGGRGPRVTDDPIEAGYFGVLLWAQAVEAAGSAEPALVRLAVKDQSLAAPEGIVYVDSDTQHTWKTVRIGRVRADGQFDIVWSSDKPVRPVPFPAYRSRADWEALLNRLSQGWGGGWAPRAGH